MGRKRKPKAQHRSVLVGVSLTEEEVELLDMTREGTRAGAVRRGWLKTIEHEVVNGWQELDPPGEPAEHVIRIEGEHVVADWTGTDWMIDGDEVTDLVEAWIEVPA